VTWLEGAPPTRRMGWLRRHLHVHVYKPTDDGPIDPETMEPFVGPWPQGPCLNLWRCRCGKTHYQRGWIRIG
jgi:hypothetical protein